MTKSKARSVDELRVRQRYQLVGNAINSFTVLARSALFWGGLGWISWEIGFCVEVLAGKKTEATFVASLLGNVRISETLAWAVSVLTTGYGLRQRKLRRDTIERLSGDKKRAEALLDSGRTSSQLTRRGETAEGDKP